VCLHREKTNSFVKPAIKVAENKFPRYKEEIFYSEGGETLEQVAQRSGRCPIPGNIQAQAGRGSEQPDLVGGVPVYCRSAGQDDL